MSLFHICQFPDPVLRKVSKPVIQIDSDIRSFVKSLIAFMRAQPGGVGIAAPQVGVLKRIAVVDLSRKVAGSEQLILINPEIISQTGFTLSREGCMSLPDYTANVSRAAEIILRWQDLDLNVQERHMVDLEARCVQHEVDHLNGFLFVDRVSSIKGDVYRRKRYL